MGGIVGSKLCILSVNGEFYGQPNWGGMTSPLLPGRIHGPISIEPGEFGRIEHFGSSPSMPDNSQPPSLHPGTNEVSVYYPFRNKWIQSPQFELIAE